MIIEIGKKGLILKLNNKEEKNISFFEIKKIFIKTKKTPLIYVLLFAAISFSIVLLSLWIFGFKLILISQLFLILIGVIKLNNYKRCVLKIKLKDGNSVIMPIPFKFKYKTIEDINKIRKELLILN